MKEKTINLVFYISQHFPSKQRNKENFRWTKCEIITNKPIWQKKCGGGRVCDSRWKLRSRERNAEHLKW